MLVRQVYEWVGLPHNLLTFIGNVMHVGELSLSHVYEGME